MTYSEQDASGAIGAMAKYRGSDAGELGAALAVFGLSAHGAEKDARLRDDMIRFAHNCGASIRQLAEVSGLNRKTVNAIVTEEPILNPPT